MVTTPVLNATTHRWVAELADFKFAIKYRPGKANIDADALSRLPIEKIMAYCTEITTPNITKSIRNINNNTRARVHMDFSINN